MKLKNLIVFSFLFVFIICGCASLQKDIVVSSDSFVQTEDVYIIEEKVIEFDVRNILSGDVSSNPDLYKKADLLIKEIENSIIDSGVNKNEQARLVSLEGIVCLLQGKKYTAKELYAKAQEINKGDSYTEILGFRLGLITSLEDENLISRSNQNALLELEIAIDSFKKGEYTKSVAYFDSSFIGLPDFYKTYYEEIRQKAWDLRNNSELTEDKKILSVLNKSEITVGQMIMISQDLSDVLYFVTGGKKYSEIELFNFLNSAGYFNSAFDKNTKKNLKDSVKRTAVVDRAFCARFLWNVYCAKRNLLNQKTKYSKLYAGKIKKSPVLDVDFSNEDFDAILGVVENEIMSLKDGRNFGLHENVSASEFSSYLQKLK